VLIKQPIALDDVKKQMDLGEYSSLEAVKDDLELIFANAKQYNLTESEIFQDAKELLVRSQECPHLSLQLTLMMPVVAFRNWCIKLTTRWYPTKTTEKMGNTSPQTSLA